MNKFQQVHVVGQWSHGIMGSGHIGTPVHKETDLTENLAFPQITYVCGNKYS